MSLTGVCLVLFVTFHVLMNGVALFWPTAYNEVCLFLGANWYALIGSLGLAALFMLCGLQCRTARPAAASVMM